MREQGLLVRDSKEYDALKKIEGPRYKVRREKRYSFFLKSEPNFLAKKYDGLPRQAPDKQSRYCCCT